MSYKQITKALNIKKGVTEKAIRYYKSANNVIPKYDQHPSSVIPEFPERKYPGSNKNKRR